MPRASGTNGRADRGAGWLAASQHERRDADDEGQADGVDHGAVPSGPRRP